MATGLEKADFTGARFEGVTINGKPADPNVLQELGAEGLGSHILQARTQEQAQGQSNPLMAAAKALAGVSGGERVGAEIFTASADPNLPNNKVAGLDGPNQGPTRH
jgi:hypothetical protein